MIVLEISRHNGSNSFDTRATGKLV
jgi:hypothetical protein